MALSREQLMAHLDQKFNKYEEAASGNQLDYAKPAGELSGLDKVAAVGTGFGNVFSQAPRYAGAAGYGMAKLGQGITSGFGLAPNKLSAALGQRAEDTYEAGAQLSTGIEDATKAYDYLGKNKEQGRAIGRQSGDMLASLAVPVPGIGAVGGATIKAAGGVLKGLPVIGAAGRFAKTGDVLAQSAGASAAGALAGAQGAITTPLLSGRMIGQDEKGAFSFGRAAEEVGQGAKFGAILGGATPVGAAVAKPVIGAVGRGAAKVEEAARAGYNQVAANVGGESARMVSPVPVLGKAFPSAGQRAAGEFQPSPARGGGGAAAEAEQTAQLAAEIAAARDPLGKVTPEARQMAQVAQAFQLPKVRGFAQMEANHRTIVDGIDTVGQVIGKEIPADTVQALNGVQKAKEKLMPVITEANAKVTGKVAKEEAVAVADGILSTPEVDAELLAQGISSKSVRGWAAQLAGRSQQDLQRIKNSLAQSVSGKKVGQYQGATSDALKLRVVSQLMDDRVVAALGQSNKPVSQQLAKLNAFEKHLAGVASVDLRKADASLGVILSNALAHGDLAAAKTGVLKAGWAKAAGMLDRVRGKNNLISSVYEDVFKGGQPSGAFKVAQMGDVQAPKAVVGKAGPRVDSFPKKTQAAQDAAEASASLRTGKNVKKGDIGGGAGGQYDDAGNLVMDAEGKSVLSKDFRYHETSPKNLDSIMRNGLRPSEGQYGKGVYFSDPSGVGKQMADSEGMLVRIKRKNLDDTYQEWERPDGSVEQGWTEKEVPSEMVDVSLDGGKTWFDSMDYLRSPGDYKPQPKLGKATDKLDSAPVLGKVSADANVSAVKHSAASRYHEPLKNAEVVEQSPEIISVVKEWQAAQPKDARGPGWWQSDANNAVDYSDKMFARSNTAQDKRNFEDLRGFMESGDVARAKEVLERIAMYDNPKIALLAAKQGAVRVAERQMVSQNKPSVSGTRKKVFSKDAFKETNPFGKL